MSNREEQAAFKSWLDTIVEPTALSQRQIPRIGEVKIPHVNPHFILFRQVVEFIAAGKFASAAHAKREWRKIGQDYSKIPERG